jgi:hypothetical protein
MALIVEDGSGVAGANSYVSVAEVRAWAGVRGLTLPATDGAVEILVVKAMDFLESFRARFTGSKTDSAQALQWPRTGATLDGVALDDDVIPAELKSALFQLTVDAQTLELQPTGTGREVLREKVDVLETEYAERGSGTVQPQFTKALAFLQPLLNSGGAFGLRTVRV